MSSSLNARQQRMLERLESDGEIRISVMSAEFGVTEMTIRRDLEKMEQGGLVRRTLGGAILLGRDIALKDRTGVMAEEKQAIGRLAASLIQPGDYIFLDGGTTTIEIARAIRPGFQITVVTNALNVASELQEKKIPTIVAGGMILESTSTLVGPFTEQMVGSMAYTHVFLGTTGLTAEHGFSNSNMYEAEIKKIAILQGDEVNIVMDHSKFEVRDLFSFSGLAKTTRVITDMLPQQEWRKTFEESDVELITS